MSGMTSNFVTPGLTVFVTPGLTVFVTPGLTVFARDDKHEDSTDVSTSSGRINKSFCDSLSARGHLR